MIIACNDLTKSYGKRIVLDRVSLRCAAGEIYGLLGANGAGKTTLFKLLFGLITPDAGSINLPEGHLKPIGGIIEKPALYEYLSAQDNIRIFAGIQGMKTNRLMIEQSLTSVGLLMDRKDAVANFSMGMKQRLGIAIALLNNPACLVLDEPFNGLDPLGVTSLRKLIIDLARREQLAIIVSSHIIEELSKICDTLGVLKAGTMVKTGPASQLIAANTTSYTICGENIQHSIILKDYTIANRDNCVQVNVSSNEIECILQAIYKEGISITACIPQLNMEKLFEMN